MTIARPLAGSTWLLACDLCGNRTRLPDHHADLNRYLYEWKLIHDGHVYLDRPGVFNPPMTEPFNAIPAPCHELTEVSA